MKKLCLPLVLCCVLGCGGGWEDKQSPFDFSARQSVHRNPVSDVTDAMLLGGTVVMTVGVIGYWVDPANHDAAEDYREWPKPTVIVGGALFGIGLVYEAIYDPKAARRDSNDIRLAVAPDRLMLVCQF